VAGKGVGMDDIGITQINHAHTVEISHVILVVVGTCMTE
jgi:hypothetical protein